MADDRSGPGAADEVHDDDELADLLAAELQRYATGVVPVLPTAQAAEPPALAAEPPAPPEAATPFDVSDADEAPIPSPRPSGRRAAERTEPVGPPPPSDVPPAFERSGRRVQDVLTWATGEHRTLPAVPVEEPVRRRRGYLPPTVSEVPPVDPVEPLDRVLPTGPVSLPEPTAALLHEMVADQGGPPVPRARHAAPPATTTAFPDDHGVEALRETGPMTVPRPLYSDWEQSLRAIGRPRSPWDEDDDEPVGGASPDDATVAIPVPRRTGAAPPPVPAEDPAPTGRVRRARRRPEAPVDDRVAEAEPIAILAAEEDDDGVDDVATEHRSISAATSGAIDLPVREPRPRTAPLLIERVRTAILQLPVIPASPTGSAGPGIAGRWTGALATPLLLLVAFGLGTAGAGPVDALPLLLGAAVLLPAAVRSAAWSATADRPDREEPAAFGRTGGAVWAGVLLLARVAAATGTLFALSSILSAWVARTGALGGSASTAGLAAAVAGGLIALIGALLPVRALTIAVQVLGALAAVGTVLLVLLLAPSAGAPRGGAAAAAAAAGAGVGLLLVLCGADVARWRTGFASTVGSAVGTVLGAVAGVVVLVLGLLVAAGATGDPADALAAALSDGSAAALAAPLAVVLLGSSLVLPVLLVRSAAAGGARLLGSGERLGAAAAGLLALAGALGLLSAGIAAAPGLLAVAGLAGPPVAAWAGVRTSGGDGRRPLAALVAGAGAIAGWLLVDGLLPGGSSPVLGALGVPEALRGGPVVGLAVAFVVGIVAGLLSRGPRRIGHTSADTVEG